MSAPQALAQTRHIRLFVSSSLEDMKAERDVLEKDLFRALRQTCRERGVEFTVVDLRWGIPEGEGLEVAVESCLRQVEKCHPFFIGLLGDYYALLRKGDDYQRQILLDKNPRAFGWLQDAPAASVTELEIRQLFSQAHPQLLENAHFYWRDPAYPDAPSLSQALKTASATDKPDLLARQTALAQLKDYIRQQAVPISEYATPQDILPLVQRDFSALIDRLYPAGSELTPLERDRMAHDAFAAARTRLYLSRPDDIAQLEAHAADMTTTALIISGESGCGKSALLANWATDYRAQHPDIGVIWHFTGCNADSTDGSRLVQRVLAELKAHFDWDDALPEPDAINAALPEWLARVSKPVILILDGLNQLEDAKLNWLPEFIPAPVRLFVSAAPGAVLNSLQLRDGWQNLTVALFSRSERADFSQQYLDNYGKTLKPAEFDRLAKAPQTANPLYLQVLLEELRAIGDYRHISAQIQNLLQAADPAVLYQHSLERLEQEYDRARPRLTQELMSLLWAARRGLSESELQAALAVAPARWQPLHAALDDVLALVNRGGFLNFAHDYLRQAVEARYLPDPAAQQAAHRALAEYFAQLPLDTRVADELPWQWAQAGETEELKACVSKPKLLAYYDDEYELVKYWGMVNDYESMQKTYRKEYIQTLLKEAFFEILNFIGLLKHKPRYKDVRILSGLLQTAEIHRLAVIRHSIILQSSRRELSYGNETSLSNTSVASNNGGVFDFKNQPNKYNDIEVFLKDATMLNNEANSCHKKGLYAKAEPLYQRSLTIRENALGVEHPDVASSLNNLAALYQDMGDYAQALPLTQRSLAIRENALGAEHPDVASSLNNLAALYEARGDYAQALPLYQRSLGIREKVLGAEHPDVALSLNNLAGLYKALGDYAQALPLTQRSLAIRENALGAEHPDVAASLNNLAALYEAQGDYAQALPLTQLSLAIRENALGAEHPDVAASLNNLAGLYDAQGDYGQALPLYQRSLEIWEKALGAEHPDVAQSLNNLAGLYDAQGDYGQALPLYQRSLGIWEKALGAEHPDVAQSLNNLAALYYAQGDYGQALPLYQRSLAIKEKALGAEHPAVATSLNNLAGLYDAQGDYGQALPLYQRSLAIKEKVLGAEHPAVATSLNNLAELYRVQGDYGQALPLYQHSLGILEAFEQQQGVRHPNTQTVRGNLEKCQRAME